MDLKYVCQQYFTCMCFPGFIRNNKYMLSGYELIDTENSSLQNQNMKFVKQIWVLDTPVDRIFWHKSKDKYVQSIYSSVVLS